MKDGDTVVVQCKDGYDLDSQKNTAYAMQKNGELPVCLQNGGTNTNRYTAWYQLNRCATPIDATRKKEAAELLGVERHTVRRWELDGWIRFYVRKAGRAKFTTGKQIIKCWETTYL